MAIAWSTTCRREPSPQPTAPAARLAEAVPATPAAPEAASRAPAALPPPAAEATPPGSEAASPPSADPSPAPVSPAGPPPRTPDPTGATAVAALAPSPAAPGTDALPPPPDLPGAAAEEISMEIPKAEPEAEAEATPPTTLPAATRVFVHHPPGKRAAAQAAAAALTDAGVADVTIVAAPVSIARTNVRFFHAADADAAREIAGLLPPTGGAPETRDFTDFTPPPRTGMVEVWLAGEAPDAPAPARTTAVRAPAPPILVLPSPAEDVAEEVARILVQRALDSLSEGRP
jgi:hypothetical protein